MHAYAARPAAGRAGKGIIILQEAFGVNDYIRRMVDRFTGQGFLAIAPELFHRTRPGFEADYEKREGVVPGFREGEVRRAGGKLRLKGFK